MTCFSLGYILYLAPITEVFKDALRKSGGGQYNELMPALWKLLALTLAAGISSKYVQPTLKDAYMFPM
ncbi:MAG: hypothetical protein GSR79_09565 [Desulfurococcales archaeon]|nr:hypothetical protein [Desulfurococcales archaeon]